MDPKEIRMRCIEALRDSGVRAPARIISDAKVLEEWVSAAPDKDPTPGKATRKKAADKS